MSQPAKERQAERKVVVAFGVTVVAATALAITYWQGGHPQWEGVLLAIALAGLGCGFVLWANGLLPGEPVEEERETLPTTEDERDAFEKSFERGKPVARRKVLSRMLALAGAALGAAAVFPIRSLGPGPGRTLERTSWKQGLRLVDEAGRVVRADDLPVGAVITVFPEGHAGSADAQALLIRLQEGVLQPKRGRESWAPQGFVAYSKVCTHAGCPVGLYQVDTQQLLCPCHQSAFDVLDAARPVVGPAVRPLPQLPLEVGPDGEIRAMGDFSDPIGPSYWNRP